MFPLSHVHIPMREERNGGHRSQGKQEKEAGHLANVPEQKCGQKTDRPETPGLSYRSIILVLMQGSQKWRPTLS